MNYHIIQIDNSRQDNITEIENILGDRRAVIPVVNAHNESDLKEFYSSNLEFRVTGAELTKPEVGCFASHYLAWKYIVKNKLEDLLILEDDALLKNNFLNKYTSSKKKLPKDYDMFFLYANRYMAARFSIKDHYIKNHFIARAYQDWSTLAYLISYEGAVKAIDLTHKMGMIRPVDNFLLEGGENRLLNVYAPKPPELLPIEINEKYESTIRTKNV
jgi:glycosyl transferase family 25